jgi:hypothetical protein
MRTFSGILAYVELVQGYLMSAYQVLRHRFRDSSKPLAYDQEIKRVDMVKAPSDESNRAFGP